MSYASKVKRIAILFWIGCIILIILGPLTILGSSSPFIPPVQRVFITVFGVVMVIWGVFGFYWRRGLWQSTAAGNRSYLDLYSIIAAIILMIPAFSGGIGPFFLINAVIKFNRRPFMPCHMRVA